MSSDLDNLLLGISNFGATEFEKNFHWEAYCTWSLDNLWMVAVILSVYLLGVFGGQKLMENYKPFDLIKPLAMWNAFLSVFSFIGMVRTVPFYLHILLNYTFKESVCRHGGDAYGHGPVQFWVFLFIFSKIPELVDTVFIVLRKKPLIFLHWYHHVTVLAFCWHSYATISGSGLAFVAMNYSVHSIMYGYYCAQALRCVPKWFPTILITVGQISQMFYGTFLCFYGCYFKLTGGDCSNDTSNLIAGALMYASYLYLFCEFAMKRYGGGKKPSSKKKE